MRILFFDTETTNLPKDYRAPATDTDNWPRMIEIGFLQHNTETGKQTAQGHIIKPEGFEIPEDAVKIHGITTERAMEEGVSLRSVLDVLSRRILEADLIVGHNISFDRKIVGAEFIRCGMPDVLHHTSRTCTMMKSTKYCNVPFPSGRRGAKFPSLQELHVKLFGAEFDGAHGALADIEATARCYFELVKLRVVGTYTGFVHYNVSGVAKCGEPTKKDYELSASVEGVNCPGCKELMKGAVSESLEGELPKL